MYGWFLVVVTVLANGEVSGVALDHYWIYGECNHAAHMHLDKVDRGETLVCIEDMHEEIKKEES